MRLERCTFCDKQCKGGTGRAAHERYCPQRPKAEVVPAKRQYKKKITAMVQEQNVETATAYVIAAKFPQGVPVEDIPRVIRLVKAVEHG